MDRAKEDGVMRIKTLAATALAAMVMVAGISADAKAEVIEKTTFRGAFAFAFFSQTTPITCADGTSGTIETTASVSGNEFLNRSRTLPDEDVNAVSIVATRFNSCTGEFLFGQATVDNTFTQSALQSATLVASVTLVDLDGNPVGTAAVNLSLEGTGATSFNQFHSRFVFEGPNGEEIVSTSHSKGSSRNVTASGSVVVFGVELIGGFQAGSLQQVKSGSSQLQRK
jgi:hypothetical protein